MSPETYAAVCELFEELLPLVAERRAAHAAASGRSAEVVRRALELAAEADALDATDSGRLFLEPPADPSASTDPDRADSRGAAARVPALGTRIGGCELVEKLGEGGMGVVFRAWEPRAERTVALKMIRAGRFAGEADLRRFATEAKAVAALDHPGIAPLLEVGEHEGLPYFTMAFVAGKNLKQTLDGRPLPPERAVELVRQVADAVAYAHSRGVLHRDLKPSNVLLDEQGRPRLTDFGLAKRLDAPRDADGGTLTGEGLGTPAYMAPEQIQDARRLGPATDVYGLGAILFEALTGRPPFVGETVGEVLSAVLELPPPAPRRLQSDLDPALEAICLRCLAKDPRDRYPSAAALAEDLARWLRGDPPLIRPLSMAGFLERMIHHRVRGRAELVRALVGRGVTAFLTHAVLIAGLVALEAPLVWLWIAFGATLATHAFLIWLYYLRPFFRLYPSERQSGIVSTATFLAHATAFLLHGPLAPEPTVADFLAMYATLALLSGAAMFIHGYVHWGRWYVIGGAFYPLAVAMPWVPTWAPFLFGSAYLLTLGWAAWQLRRLARLDASGGATLA